MLDRSLAPAESRVSLVLTEMIIMAFVFTQEKSGVKLLTNGFHEKDMETTCIVTVMLAIVIIRVIIFSPQSIKGLKPMMGKRVQQ